MKNTIANYLFILSSIFIYSQNTISGTLEFKNSIKKVILYNVNAFEKVYIKHAYVKDNQFELKLKKKLDKGVYKIELDRKNKIDLNILFTGNDIDISWGNDKIKLSDETADLFYRYTNINNQLQNKIDETQINYFKAQTSEISDSYNEGLDVLTKFHNKVYKSNDDVYFKKILKLTKGYNSQNIIDSPIVYLDSIKEHHFDRIDFSDDQMLYSYLTTELIIDYIFYMNYSDNKSASDRITKENIEKVVNLIPNPKYNSEMYLFLLNKFLNEKNTEMSSFIKDKYTNMPVEFLDLEYLKSLEKQQTLTVNAIAPNFDWTDKGIKKNLHDSLSKKRTILVFWSSECSHCLRDIPILKDSLNSDETQVVAIALERKEKKWRNEIVKYEDWTHVLALKKWDNHIATLYDIIGTPSYFILDENAKILSKPSNVKGVLNWIKNN